MVVDVPAPTFTPAPIATGAPRCPHCASRLRFTAGDTDRDVALFEDLAPWSCLDCGAWGVGDDLEDTCDLGDEQHLQRRIDEQQDRDEAAAERWWSQL